MVMGRNTHSLRDSQKPVDLIGEPRRQRLACIALMLALSACADPDGTPDSAVADAAAADAAEAAEADADADADAADADAIAMDGGVEDSSPLDAPDGHSLDASDGGVDSGPMPGEWHIPSSMRVGPKLTMYPLYPRPDEETSSNAYHRRAHPMVPYRVRIGVQGGEWPFLYELVEAPEGASFIASELARETDGATGRILHTAPEGYGVIAWTPTSGTHDFRVRVTDQGGETVEFSWQVTTDESAFVFVDSERGDDGAAGTFEDPLETFSAGLWRSDDNDTSFAGRVAVFRAGSYSVFADAENTSPVLNPERKPIALTAYPGEEVAFDLSRGHFRTTGEGFDDGLIAGIDFSGSRTDLPNNRLFNITSDSDRITFWNVSFDETTIGTRGTDNPGCIAFMSDGPYHENVAVVDSRLGPRAAAQLIVTFDTDYLLLEGNAADRVAMDGSNGSYFLHPKDDSNHVTVRHNTFRGVVAVVPIAPTNQITLESATDQEVCWNTVIHDGYRNVDSAVEMNGSSSTQDAMNTYVYRNTVVSQRRAFRFSGNTSPSEFEANAYFGGSAGIFGSNFFEGEVANQELMETDFDDAGRLAGSARMTHGGTAGAEILVGL